MAWIEFSIALIHHEPRRSRQLRPPNSLQQTFYYNFYSKIKDRPEAAPFFTIIIVMFTRNRFALAVSCSVQVIIRVGSLLK